MKLATKILGSVAIAGILASGGSAFTGAGLNLTGSASSNSFVGGSVTQTVSGAQLKSVAYHTAAADSKEIDQITLTFTGSVGDMAALAAKAQGDITAVATGATNGTDAPFTCLQAVQGIVTTGGGKNDDTAVSVCTGSKFNVASLAVTVAGSTV
jgi:hypothetical protein